MKVDDDFAPLHQGTQATIRATSLSGIANRYVSLQPGPNNARRSTTAARIAADDTTAPVDLDPLFNTLDPQTRAGLQNFIRGSADCTTAGQAGRGRRTKYFCPSCRPPATSRRAGARPARARALRGTPPRPLRALAERRDDLAASCATRTPTFGAIGDENASLDQALELLPDTLRKANTTFVNLRSTLDDLDKLVAVSKPATKQLAPFLARAAPAGARRAAHDPGPEHV